MKYLLTDGRITWVNNMARKPRIHYSGALYHVMVRGNNGEKVLLEEIHKRKYLDVLAFYKEKLYFILYAFCIMDNHAHLLLEVDEVPLSQIMQRIQLVYTQWFNRKYDRTGHVFQQRYKALLCDKENYLMQLIKYIHNNPVKANLDGGIDYKWSSHAYYTGKKTGNIVDRREALGFFSENRARAIKQYLQFMEQEEGEIIYQDIQDIDEDESENQVVNRGDIKPAREINIDEIIEKFCAYEHVTVSELTKKSKTQKVSDVRKAIVLLSEKYCNISNTLLAKKLNLSPSMISKIKSGESKGVFLNDVILKWEQINNQA
ncbi:MAG: transposase [Desulfotomaculaceae bacterium]|nr:transposase [Desulfotomaculaceae bacterium]